MGFKFNALTGKFDLVNDGGTGSSTFIDLSDVDPTEYTGQAGKVVAVNDTADGLEFKTIQGLIKVNVEIDDDYQALGTENNIFCDTELNEIELTLPDITELDDGYEVFVKDLGYAQYNNITILPYSTEEIDGETSYVIDSNKMGRSFILHNGNWWVK